MAWSRKEIGGVALAATLGVGAAYLAFPKEAPPVPAIQAPRTQTKAAVQRTIPSLRCPASEVSPFPPPSIEIDPTELQALVSGPANPTEPLEAQVQNIWTRLTGEDGKPEDPQATVAALNESLNPAGYSLILTEDSSFLALYPIQEASACTAKDNQSSQDLTLLFLEAPKWHLGSSPSMEVFTDRSQRKIFVPMEQQALHAEALNAAFTSMGLYANEKFLDSRVTDLLRYETTGWLLEDRFAEALASETCKTISLKKGIPNTQKEAQLQGCYSSQAFLELCKHGAEFAGSTQAALWTFTAMVGVQTTREDQKLTFESIPFFLGTFPYPSGADTTVIQKLNADEPTEVSREALQKLVAKELRLKGVKEVGIGMYATCYGALSDWDSL